MESNARSMRMRGRLRRLLPALAGAAVISLALSACGGAPATNSTDPNAQLRVGLHGGGVWETLDPHVLNSGYSEFIGEGLFEPLFAYDGNNEFQNVLGESIESNADYTEWTVTLKSGVKFTDGTPLTADDVVFSFERILDPATGASSAGQVGMISTVTAPDDLTVVFALTQPTSWFPTAIAEGGAVGIIPRDFDVEHPVSTGPYAFVDYQAGAESNWTRFDGYHGTPAKIKDLALITLDDPDARTNALVAGQVDMITFVPPASAPTIEANPNLAVQSYETGGFDFVSVRTDEGPTADPRVREAIKLAVDRDKIIDVVYGGDARKASDVYAPFDQYFDTSLVREQNLPEAQRLIQEAGASGQKLVFSTVTQWQAITEVVAEAAAAAGLDASVDVVDEAAYWPALFDFQASSLTFPGTHFLTMTAISATASSYLNTSRFADPEFNELYAQASSVPEEAQGPMITRMQQIFFDQGGVIIPVFKNYVIAHSTSLTGFPEQNKSGLAVSRSLSVLSFAE